MRPVRAYVRTYGRPVGAYVRTEIAYCNHVFSGVL
jgi:hypothetical protein